MKRIVNILLLMVITILSGCGTRYVPRPYGYFRITLPEPSYRSEQLSDAPVVAEVSRAAMVQTRGDDHWFDIYYPTFSARIHCSYKPVNGNLRSLSDDAQEFVFKHAGVAQSIPEQEYADPQNHIYGLYYELQGNTASPCQFYLTDSTHHFFRGAVYFNCVPNQDSLQPVVNYLIEDVKHLIETTRWTTM